MLTDTYNSDTAAGVEFISSQRRMFCRREAPVLEFLFYKAASLQACNVTKKDSYTGLFL